MKGWQNNVVGGRGLPSPLLSYHDLTLGGGGVGVAGGGRQRGGGGGAQQAGGGGQSMPPGSVNLFREGAPPTRPVSLPPPRQASSSGLVRGPVPPSSPAAPPFSAFPAGAGGGGGMLSGAVGLSGGPAPPSAASTSLSPRLNHASGSALGAAGQGGSNLLSYQQPGGAAGSDSRKPQPSSYVRGTTMPSAFSNDYNDGDERTFPPEFEPPFKPFSASAATSPNSSASRSDGSRFSYNQTDSALSTADLTSRAFEKEKKANKDLLDYERGSISGGQVELAVGRTTGEEGLFGEGMVYISQIIQQRDLLKKRVAELENDIQLSRIERGSFIEQINKQFKEEEKLLATIQTMKSEFDELRANYTKIVSQLQDSRDPSITETLREENSILKEKLKIVESQIGDKGVDISSLYARSFSPPNTDKLTETEIKLKRAMEEKKMLIEALNDSMNTASLLEQENKQLQEIENRLRNGLDEKSTPESIIRQIELNGSSVLMYTCTRLQDKIGILVAAIATHNPNVIMTVILYLRDTLSQVHLFEILAEPKHVVALNHYRNLLRQCGYESELAQLYHFLSLPQKEGMFMLKQACRIKNPTERMNALLLCASFYAKHEGLQWYGEQLQQQINHMAYHHPRASDSGVASTGP